MILLLALQAWSADVFVCGEEVEPPCLDTVQQAVDAAADGDRVVLPRGLFEASVLIRDRTLTLAGRRRLTREDRTDLTGTDAGPPLRIEGGAVTLLDLGLRPRTTRALEIAEGAVVRVERCQLVGGSSVQVDGGLVHAQDSAVTFADSTLEGGRAVRDGGTVYAVGGPLRFEASSGEAISELRGGHAGRAGGLIFASDLEVVDTLLRGGRADLGGGVAVARQGSASVSGIWRTRPGEEPHPARIEASEASTGGAIHADDGSSLSLSDVYVDGSVGGAIFLGDGARLEGSGIFLLRTQGLAIDGIGVVGELDDGRPSTVAESFICGGTSDGLLVRASGLTLTHSFVLANQSEDAVFSGRLVVDHVHVVGNSASRALERFSGSFRNNLVAYNDMPTTIGLGVGGLARRNLWWANEGLDGQEGGSLDAEAIVADPMVASFDAIDCDAFPELFPSWYGAARGALVVDGLYDGDGLPMPGAWGGIQEPLLYTPNGSPAVADAYSIVGDDDGDGVVNFYDCRYADRDIFPGADEIPYDGIDGDCDGSDDFDVDGDGERAVGEIRGGTDCDDTDPRRGALREEVDDNGIDDDCDGWADARVSLRPRGCSSTPAPTGALLLLSGLLAGLRRRRSPDGSSLIGTRRTDT